MATVYVILGEANTRKSATVRALTGIYNRRASETAVATNERNLDIFIQVSALQESHIPPQEFIDEVNRAGYQNVLVTLRISKIHSGGKIYPSGLTYIQAFMNSGWHVQRIVVLGTSTLPRPLPDGTPVPIFIHDSATGPVNTTAFRVRELWGWL